MSELTSITKSRRSGKNHQDTARNTDWPHLSHGIKVIWMLLAFALANGARAQEPTPVIDDYDQWKEALRASEAVDASRYTAPDGFEIRLIRSARPDEGSWISMAFDPQGRLIIAREDQGLLRLTPPQEPGADVQIETINSTLLECRGLLFAHDALYVNANNSRALYRLRDTNGDGHYEESTLLRSTSGGVGHGRNNLALGPDGLLYLIHGNDVLLPEDFIQGLSPLRNYEDDRLLPARWDGQFFDAQARMPAGHVIRTDADGERWELVCGGMRNPYGIAFNEHGEMFSYDADMEWDVGTPWYRPTRIHHMVSGADYGWRQGSKKWPPYFADTLPSNLDLGLGSPTAVCFGHGGKLPPRLRRALLVCDWAYGRILAVHMTPRGASYECHAEEFIRGRPLNVTDLTIGPDGALYFSTGGRKTQSGLYRVDFVGEMPPEIIVSDEDRRSQRAAADARKTRRSLETFHGNQTPGAIEQAWPHLQSDDVWIAHAARVAIEQQPVASWLERALQEPHPIAASRALLALARVGSAKNREAWLSSFHALRWPKLSEPTKEILLRALSVALVRMGRPDSERIAKLIDSLELGYPTKSPVANQLLCELLVFLDSRVVVERTMAILPDAKSQEEKIGFLFALRSARFGWSPESTHTYFLWLRQAREFYGARDLPRFIDAIREDAVARLDPTEKQSLGALLEAPKLEASPTATPARPFVKDWEFDDLVDSLVEIGQKRDVKQGETLFAEAFCTQCHQLRGKGTALGPDLTGLSGRFSRRDILRSLLAPSEVVAEKFRDTVVIDTDGNVTVGRILGERDNQLLIAPTPTDPQHVVRLATDIIVTRLPSMVSPMPANLLDSLNKDEILDLLAFLESNHAP
jgi:putative heme-binding domain-containing protein